MWHGAEIGVWEFIHINAGLSEISLYIYASDNALLRRVHYPTAQQNQPHSNGNRPSEYTF